MAEHIVHAPFPGVFYRRPDPESPPFVNESDTVASGSVVGLIEVMKMFQEIRSEADGTVTEFLVENEAAVDAGQPLMRLT
ncbi:MAG: putative biotin carboxyl carrier protein [Pseudonocardia sp.]|jgi:acetyl-CoA carboxylase biotin carboxyl carrier protein|uniref:acetyl-CoA carboxylase n=1 Tax=Pseudonocardia sp. TaxID=60912 RepID=UPI0026141D16|nr:acetyl-CoA carboxylase [Pseudonocardia sp.]MCU1627348.1 putative biotin carboxyl carrier protein [Pseudonocardia sp.]